MKEHETVYACMPLGPIENIQGIYKCAFCEIRDPSFSHLQEHHASECTGSSNLPLTKSRKSNMIQHLAAHNITGQAASALAGKWRYKLGRTAFSCGFCVTLFFTQTEQLNHIDNEHFAKGQAMNEWTQTNVIKGLLLQPAVNDAWQAVLSSHPRIVTPELRWNLLDAETLQLSLELGKQGCDELAIVALSASNHDAIDCCQHEVKTTPVSVEINLEAGSLSFDHPSSATTMYPTAFESSHDQASEATPYGTSAWHGDSTCSAWSGPNYSRCLSSSASASYPPMDRPFFNNASNMNFDWDGASVNPVSSTTHTQPPLHNASEPSFPCGTWPGLSVGADIQDSSRAVRALPRHQVLQHQVLHSGRGHPASFATPKTESWIFPPRLHSRNDTSMSLSPAACEASAMLWNQTDVSRACHEKPLPAPPAPGLELGPSSPIDFDFGYI